MAGATAARRPLPDFAASISRAMTRPCGPDPVTRVRSIPASFASRRASGDEKILPPTGAVTPSTAAFGGDLSPLRRGEEL